MAENIGKRLEKKEPKQTKKPGRLTKQQKWLLAAAIVLAAVLLAVVAWKSVFVKPELPGGTKPDGTHRKRHRLRRRRAAAGQAASARARMITRC